MRLRMLLLHNNHISRIQDQLGSSLPMLEVLILNNNKLKSMDEIKRLVDLRQLEVLSLVGNPICSQKNYRQMIISAFPNLRILDYQKIKPQEREKNAPSTTNTVPFMEEEKAQDNQQPVVAATIRSTSPSLTNNSTKSVDESDSTTNSIQEMKQAIAKADSVERVNQLEAQLQHEGMTTIVQDVDMAEDKGETEEATIEEATTIVQDVNMVETEEAKADEEMEEAKEDPDQVSTTLTKDQVDQMKVVDLKEALKSHQLSTAGRKAELLERLKDFLF